MITSNIEIKVLVIEDNQDDAFFLKRLLLSNEDFVSVKKCVIAKNFKQALITILHEPIDVVLLNLYLADSKSLNAIEEFWKKSANIPSVVISSLKASEFAIRVLSKGVLDFLVKDEISPYLLNRTIAFALERHKTLKANRNEESGRAVNVQPEEIQTGASLFVKSGSKYVSILRDDIHYVEAKGDYIIIYTHSGKYIVTSSMNQIESKLCLEKFVRIHRSFIVNINKISTLQENIVSVNGTTITIGRTYKQDLMSRINKL